MWDSEEEAYVLPPHLQRKYATGDNLRAAARNGILEDVKSLKTTAATLLTEDAANEFASAASAASAAASNGHLDCVKYLHFNGARCNYDTAMSTAEGGNLDCLQFLHESGCEMEGSCWNHAARCGHLDVLQYLHANGCAFNGLNVDPATHAAANGQLACLQYCNSIGFEPAT